MINNDDLKVTSEQRDQNPGGDQIPAANKMPLNYGGQPPQQPSIPLYYYLQPHFSPAGGQGYDVADSSRTTPARVQNQPVKGNKGLPWLRNLGALLLIGLLGLMAYFLIANNTSGTATSTGVTSSTALATNPTQTNLTVQQVVDLVKPAVVQITTEQTINTTNPFIGSGSGQAVTGIGSGIIYDKTGYILTNFHVIQGASSLLVTLPDGRSFVPTVVGSDQQTDLAVLKIDPKGTNLPVAQLGDSSALQVGDGLVAIGNALGLPGGPTVTSGVVSALDRSVTEPSTSGSAASANSAGPQLYGLLQTDAAINPGNSGGPLVNMQGQVIGINTLGAGMAEPGVQSEGIGFAISVNQAKTIAQQLVANGTVIHPYMGISYQPLTPAIASQLGLNSSVSNGAVIAQVQSGSPAAQAGLKQGDVIVSVDGQNITGESMFGLLLNQHKPGDQITLVVISPQSTGGYGQPRPVDVTLAQRPAN